jgi:hypothetical protein
VTWAARVRRSVRSASARSSARVAWARRSPIWASRVVRRFSRSARACSFARVAVVRDCSAPSARVVAAAAVVRASPSAVADRAACPLVDSEPEAT